MHWSRLAQNALIVVLVVLAALGLLVAPPPGLIGALITLPFLGGMLGFALVTSRADQAGPPPIRHGVRVGLTTALTIAAAVAVPGGVAVLAGGATGPVLLLAALAAAPWAWIRLRPHLHGSVTARLGLRPSAAAGPTPVAGDRPLARATASLSTAALCAEWQRSLRMLTQSTDRITHADIAELRRRYLDELERRDPDALSRWLATDPDPAATSPEAHLTTLGAEAPEPAPEPSDGDPSDPDAPPAGAR